MVNIVNSLRYRIFDLHGYAAFIIDSLNFQHIPIERNRLASAQNLLNSAVWLDKEPFVHTAPCPTRKITCSLIASPLTCSLVASPLTCSLVASPLTCSLVASPLTCSLVASPLTCSLVASPLTCSLVASPLTCSLVASPLTC